jgi:hypothetical protein
MEIHSDPVQAIVRFTSGQATDIDRAVLQKGFHAFLNADGAVPLERCLGIPTTPAGWRKARRDSWLCTAAGLLDATGSATGARALKSEWDRFISRGPWNAWRDEMDPPAGATPLSRALFYATMLNRSDSLTTRQLARIVGHIF